MFRGIHVVLNDSMRFTKKLCTRKKVSALKLPSCGPVVFIKMDTYMFKKGRNFESYNCFGHLLRIHKKILNIEVKMMSVR